MVCQKGVIPLCRDQQSSILQVHLSILKKIVKNRQNISFYFLNAFQHQYPSLCSSLDSTLVHIVSTPS